MHVCMCVHTYIYIYRERERDRYNKGAGPDVNSPFLLHGGGRSIVEKKIITLPTKNIDVECDLPVKNVVFVIHDSRVQPSPWRPWIWSWFFHERGVPVWMSTRGSGMIRNFGSKNSPLHVPGWGQVGLYVQFHISWRINLAFFPLAFPSNLRSQAYARMNSRAPVCMCECMYPCMYSRMHSCMCECMCESMYVCMCTEAIFMMLVFVLCSSTCSCLRIKPP